MRGYNSRLENNHLLWIYQRKWLRWNRYGCFASKWEIWKRKNCLVLQMHIVRLNTLWKISADMFKTHKTQYEYTILERHLVQCSPCLCLVRYISDQILIYKWVVLYINIYICYRLLHNPGPVDVWSSVRWETWASYQIRIIAGCACAGTAGNFFPATAG